MATRLDFIPDPDSCLWINSASDGDPLRCLFPPGDYTIWLPIEQVFMANGGRIFFQPGRKGQGLLIDTVTQEAYLIRAGMVKRTAGMRGGFGYKTGPGNQAQLAVGGLQDAYSMEVDSKGRFIFPSAKAGKISRLTINPDGSSFLEAITDYTTNAVAVDAFDNLWTTTGQVIRRISPDGSLKDYGIPFGNVQQIYRTLDYLTCMTRNNSWDICFKFDPLTGQSTRLAGMNDAEVDAWIASGKKLLVDGAAINGATFHSTNICGFSPDKKKILFCGGDERQVRVLDLTTGRVGSIIIDGSVQETQIRLEHSNDGGPEPQYFTSVGGDLDNLWRYGIWYQPSGTGIKAVGKMVKVEVEVPPGGNMDGYLDKVTTDNKVAGWARDQANMNATQTVQIKIDGVAAGSIVADTPSGDVGNHRFAWPIPDSFKDGKNHVVTGFVGTFELKVSTGSVIQFNIPAVIVPPPPPVPAPPIQVKIDLVVNGAVTVLGGTPTPLPEAITSVIVTLPKP